MLDMRLRKNFAFAGRIIALGLSLVLFSCAPFTVRKRYRVPDALLGEWLEMNERDFRDSLTITKEKIAWTRRDPLNAGEVDSTPDEQATDKVKTVWTGDRWLEIYSPFNYQHPDWFHVASLGKGEAVIFRIINRRQIEGSGKLSSLMQVKLSMEEGKIKMESVQKIKDGPLTPKLQVAGPIHETQWFEKVGN